ncbi:purine catabolism regulatory protein [Streptomyces sp. 2224.1]|uniref:PucR family transcriptional regulator n=1 Tax=unclassified Streptomyces TaxID=2593676 RepID=UPI00088E5B7E|nr:MULTISPECIES: PucR family transcriptional regulator [unclassified Streptomyces]PBC85656.1 purine catabolism regulator [Streptomyces sp. 2321.6]SDR09392.1 purine catabolism regulatory protein [Streptomyces sp. KS_16]SED75107.1 purine catabolism regulatory protein [Streptomyces sp. 2133.1]SEE24608.1 purine catabolism regulatory protein [Streptomyces sp. 2224.1]SNC72414.1 purine catabolism regulatory protein [Streptomyces sp. 2114.4]
MPLHLSDLLARPDLRLSVTYDVPPQQLARTIEAATVSDLPAPGKWLQGGELLMTIGLLLPMEPAACRAYVRDAAEGGAACLALGLGQGLPYQEAPEPLVRAAEEAGLPLLTVPDEVPFIAVTKAVFDARADEQRALLQRAFATQRRLTAAATGDGLRPMLAEWAAATGVGAAVLDPLGRLLATSERAARPLPAQAHELLDRVAARGLRGSASSTAAGQQLEVQPLGARRLRGLLLLTGRPDDAARSVVPGLVSLLSLELERRHLSDEPERRRRSALLSELLADEDPSADRARDMLRSVGLTAGRVRGVVVAAEGAPGGRTAAGASAAGTGSGARTGAGPATGAGPTTGTGPTAGTGPADRTSHTDGPGPTDGAAQEMAADLALAVPGGLVRVVNGAPGAVIEAVVGEELDIREVLARFAPRCPAGIGPATAPEAVRVSLRQAAGLLAVSRAGNEPAEARQSQASRLLLDLGDGTTLHGYADSVLGPLDLADHGEELIATLAAWLETGGAWDATSRRLGVHRHTVRNRLDKAMDLTGRRLDDPDDRFDLWLATRIRRGGAPSGGSGGSKGFNGSGGSTGRPAPPPPGR